MCGIIGLHLRGEAHRPRLGELLAGMLEQVGERGPDSAGVAIYGDPVLSGHGQATVSVLASAGAPGPTAAVTDAVAAAADLPAAAVSAVLVDEVLLLRAPTGAERLHAAVRAALPGAVVAGYGHDLAVLKGVGSPAALARRFGLAGRTGWQGLGHTRMATESAVTAAGCHPFSVGTDLCLVHNGSFSNYATIRRDLVSAGGAGKSGAAGAVFDSDNDSEVAARFLAACLAGGEDMDKALRRLGETLDGFYTLLVTTGRDFAVVRDAYSCKPAIIAETAEWVAMASEYRALAGLPGIADAEVYEPAPTEVYLWSR